jgi:hypothetical protein
MRKLVHLCFGVIKTRMCYQANYVAPTSQEGRYIYATRAALLLLRRSNLELLHVAIIKTEPNIYPDDIFAGLLGR